MTLLINPTRMLELLPFLRWLPPRGGTLVPDLMAGIGVALVAIPQSLAYAQLAGLPPVYGLYASLLPVIVAALFGTCSHLACGPTALSALLLASVIGGLPGCAGDPARYQAVAVLLAFLCGALLLLAGILRLGVVVNLLSQPVLKGFMNAAALLICLSQAGAVLGVQIPGSGLVATLGALASALPEVNPATVAVAVATLLLLLCGKRYAPRLPWVLLAAGLITGVVWLGGLSTGYYAVGVVGAVPGGLPPLTIPDFSTAGLPWGELLTSAAALCLILFVEVSSLTQALAAKTGERPDSDHQLAAQGLACIAGSLACAYPVSASFSRSALCLSLGGRTPLANVFSALLVLVTLLWLTPLLRYLPHATLAVIIIIAVAGLIDLRAPLQAWRISRSDGLAHTAAFLATLLLSPRVTDGILIGAGLCLILYLRKIMTPRAYLAARGEEGQMLDATQNGLPVDPQLPVLRFDGRLIFINAGHFSAALQSVIGRYPQARAVLIAGEGINDLDTTGAEALRLAHQTLARRGMRLVFCGLKAQVRRTLDRAGLTALIGAENFFPTDAAAFAALHAAPGAGAVCRVDTEDYHI